MSYKDYLFACLRIQTSPREAIESCYVSWKDTDYMPEQILKFAYCNAIDCASGKVMDCTSGKIMPGNKWIVCSTSPGRIELYWNPGTTRTGLDSDLDVCESHICI